MILYFLNNFVLLEEGCRSGKARGVARKVSLEVELPRVAKAPGPDYPEIVEVYIR